NNRKVTLGASLNLTPVDAFALQVLYLGGPEQPGDDPPWRHFLDVVATVKPTKRLSLAAHFSYGKEDDAKWYAAAGYPTVATAGTQALGLRAEVVADPDGNRTGVVTGQTLTELTGCYSWKFSANMSGRVELRLDHSSEDVFVHNDGSTGSNQVTIAANYLG